MTLAEMKKQYIDVTRIKKGGQKIVYRANTLDGRTVALKVISDSDNPRVLQEIEIVKTLNLPNVPHILDSGIVYDESISENVLYIVEEFIDGISLRDWLSKGNKADLKMAVRVLDTLLSIEIILEQRGILHRDINPNNIMLGNNDLIYLIDFGLAKNLSGPSYTLTAAAHGPFTPGYAPNEQFTNQKMLQDVRTDLFQIGVTVYETCTGKNPFIRAGDNVMQIMSRTMTFSPPSLRLAGDTKGMFADYINIMMAKNQSQRPDTAEAAYRYLNALRPTLSLEA